MKKILTFCLVLCITLSTSVGFVSADVIEEYAAMDFRYNLNGVITDYYGTSEEVAIPAELDGTPITAVGDYAFANRNVKVVYVDEGVQTIGNSCFAGTDIEYILLPESITYISKNAFANCKSLTDVCIHSYNFEIADGAFANTGFIDFCMHCSLTDVANDIIRKAKGDDEYYIDFYHPALEECVDEKDEYGNPVYFCSLCGYKGSMDFDYSEMPFDDVDWDAWYYPYVLTAYDYGILDGKTDTEFDPDGKMTLAEAAKIAACIYEYFSETGADLIAAPGEKWYQPYVNFCNYYIIDDYITFDWEKPATRAEMAYLFSRAYVDWGNEPYYINPDVPLTDIPDVYDTTPFAYEILDLYQQGIAVGDDDMMFYPDSYVKRSEAAAFISRIFSYDLRIELPKG